MSIPTDKISNWILVFFSCWCLLALPIHYFTCAVERNGIPSLDSVLNKSVVFPIQINIHCISSSKEFCANTNSDASNRLKQQFHDMKHLNYDFSLNLAQYTQMNCDNHSLLYSDVSYLSCLESMTEESENEIGSYHLYLIHSDDDTISRSWIVSPYRSAWVHINDRTMSHLLGLLDTIVYAPLEASQLNIGIKNQMFSFTLLNSEPLKEYRFVWDFDALYTNYLLPFFNRINNVLIYDYHIDSQILHYGYIISQPPTDDIHVDRADFSSILANYIQFDIDDNYFYVSNKELETFVGGTDWNRVSSLISDITPIQFVIYIPPKKYSPLHIKARVSNKTERNPYDAFLVPRFGGCVIYNPLNDSIKIKNDELYPTFSLIISQLRLLLGLRNDYNYNKENMLFIMDGSGVNEWELDILMRHNIWSDLQTVELALKNIYAMVDKVSQLPIKKDVASLITDAVHAFDEALIDCNQNRNYIRCIQWTKHSNYLAKKAEYHPSMLPALYFSPEFTYAVYSPYFLPGYIPIVAAVLKKLNAKYKEWRKQS